MLKKKKNNVKKKLRIRKFELKRKLFANGKMKFIFIQNQN